MKEKRITCWMAPEEKELILDHLKEGHRMLEWGMGGSTLEFSGHVEHYHAIEHDPDWHRRLLPELRDNTVTLLREPAWPYTPFEAAEPGQFSDYIAAIHEFDVDHFDIILVDGRARLACVMEAAKRMRRGGHLFFHDFWLRKRYYQSKDRIEEQFQFVTGITSTPQTLALFVKT